MIKQAAEGISCSRGSVIRVSRPSDSEKRGSFPFMDGDKMVVIFFLFPSSRAL